MTETKTFQTAFNERTSLYEIHAPGCRHTNLGYMKVMGVPVEAASGAAAKERFEAANEDCFAKVAPCAR